MPRPFASSVHGLVRRVPRGRVVTYGQVAALLRVPGAARAVGQAMRACPAGVPWHRVVNARGAISRRGNAGSMLSQRLLLEGEGVAFVRGAVVLARHRWRVRPARAVATAARR
ncbi:MAG TPA: methylated-DNA--[protein]-cysteine S-methyltransferase [Methylomirabilota bacterium]|nr:methylated-DNA--[protein]-cysteine S-methyltransferase [Methylomirabilota bacterium]